MITTQAANLTAPAAYDSAHLYEVRLVDPNGYSVAVTYRTPGDEVAPLKARYLSQGGEAGQHLTDELFAFGYRLSGYRVTVVDVTDQQDSRRPSA